jgi:serine/threonine-protein kinase
MDFPRTGLDAASSAGGDDESRYELLVKIASGGMATVFLGQVRGAAGFRRYVAIKRAHAHLLENPTFKQMLIDEARLASHIHHPNVISVLDVEERRGELLLVMDYVEGAALSDLLAKALEADRKVPARIALRIALDACAGLHAAHELCDENGKALGLVHRDISPHNILVGIDGAARIADFGIAKQAEGGVSTTTGSLKGKLGYMAPEYVEHGVLDARSDVFALGIVVWESLANRKLFRGSNEVETLKRIVAAEVTPLSQVAPWVGARLDDVLAAAMARLPDERFASARAFGTALESAARKDDLIASAGEVAAFVQELVGPTLERRRAQVREKSSSKSEPALGPRPAIAPSPIVEPLNHGDRPTVPDKPAGGDPTWAPLVGAGAEATGSVGASSRSVRQAESAADTAAPSIPLSSRAAWKIGALVALAGLALGAVLVVAVRPGGDAKSQGTTPAPVSESTAHPAESSTVTVTAAAPTISPSAPPTVAPSASLATSASARPWGTLPPRGKSPLPAAAPADKVAPNPYATPAKPAP